MQENWNRMLEWCFSLLGAGQKIGVNDAGIGIFKRQPYRGLAKEILQNIIDAKNEDLGNVPVKAVFKLITIKKDDLPGRERLSQVIKKCYEYYHDGDDGKKMALLAQAAESILDNADEIKVLKISDYNTNGLEGSHEEKGSNWTGLVREIGATNKGNDKSGAFGVGKFAPYNFSAIRTIIYSTKDKHGETAAQGKTILTTFRDEDGKLKQNVGLFGKFDSNTEDCSAIYDMNDIPEVFRRDEVGTDLFVIGFKEDKDWKEQITISVLDYFFYTIYKGNLEVTIEDETKLITITKSNLGALIEMYETICQENEQEFSAPMFWKVLNDTSSKKRLYKTPMCGKGEVELHLIVDNDFSERRILEMRKPGMKIQEDSKFRIAANFYGILIATGVNAKSEEPEDNINSFLRKCENQAHDMWSAEEYEEKKDEAKTVLDNIHKWIVEQVKKDMPDITKKEVDAFGLNDFLPNQYEESDDNQEEDAFMEFEPLPIEIVDIKESSGNVSTDISSEVIDNVRAKDIEVVIEGDTIDTNEKPDIKEPDPYPPNPWPHPLPILPFPFPEPHIIPGEIPEEGEYPGLDIETQRGSDNIDTTGNKEKLTSKKVKLSIVPVTKIKTPFDEQNQEYRISFIPKKSAQDVFIKIRIGGDDEDKNNAKIISATNNGNNLPCDNSMISGIQLVEHVKYILKVKIQDCERCVLEVRVYVKQ